MVVPVEVIEAVEETVARIDGEAAKGHAKVTGRDLQQWNKVVLCHRHCKCVPVRYWCQGSKSCGDDSVSETSA